MAWHGGRDSRQLLRYGRSRARANAALARRRASSECSLGRQSQSTFRSEPIDDDDRLRRRRAPSSNTSRPVCVSRGWSRCSPNPARAPITSIGRYSRPPDVTVMSVGTKRASGARPVEHARTRRAARERRASTRAARSVAACSRASRAAPRYESGASSANHRSRRAESPSTRTPVGLEHDRDVVLPQRAEARGDERRRRRVDADARRGRRPACGCAVDGGGAPQAAARRSGRARRQRDMPPLARALTAPPSTTAAPAARRSPRRARRGPRRSRR